MASCYEIPFNDGRVERVITKWGETPKEALTFARKSVAAGIVLGEPRLAKPQPFTPEAAAATERRYCRA